MVGRGIGLLLRFALRDLYACLLGEMKKGAEGIGRVGVTQAVVVLLIAFVVVVAGIKTADAMEERSAFFSERRG